MKLLLLYIQKCNFQPFLNGVVDVAAFSSTGRYQDLAKPCQGISSAPKTTSCLQQFLDVDKLLITGSPVTNSSCHALLENGMEKLPRLLSSWLKHPHLCPGLGTGQRLPATQPFFPLLSLLHFASPAASHDWWWYSMKMAILGSPWRARGCGHATFSKDCIGFPVLLLADSHR